MKTDKEMHNLRGPVQSVRVELVRFEEENGRRTEKPWYGYSLSFNPEGQITAHVHYHPDGSSWRTSNDYSEAGKLLATRSYDASGQLSHQVRYVYDADGRLAAAHTVRARGEMTSPVTYSYYTQGRKTKTEVIEYEEACGVAGDNGKAASCATGDAGGAHIMFALEGTDSAFGVPGARTVKTIYEPSGKPVELAFYGARGALLQKVVLTYDAGGRLIEETQYGSGGLFPCGSQRGWARWLAPVGLRLAKAFLFGRSAYLYSVRRGELRKVGRSMLYGTLLSETAYAYDAQGRRSERVIRFCGSTGERTGYSYDKEGNQVEEASYDECGSLHSKAIFTRKVDGHGNWTEEIVSSASSWEAEFGLSTPQHVTRRALTYY